MSLLGRGQVENKYDSFTVLPYIPLVDLASQVQTDGVWDFSRHNAPSLVGRERGL
jgi:hypothetical protein